MSEETEPKWLDRPAVPARRPSSLVEFWLLGAMCGIAGGVIAVAPIPAAVRLVGLGVAGVGGVLLTIAMIASAVSVGMGHHEESRH